MQKPFENKCPICKSGRLEYDALEPVDEFVKQEIHCRECNTDFTIWTEPYWQIDISEERKNVLNHTPIKVWYDINEKTYMMERDSEVVLTVPKEFVKRITSELILSKNIDEIINGDKTELASEIAFIIWNKSVER